jgi:tetratricopeptide (TPR) repeat protein
MAAPPAPDARSRAEGLFAELLLADLGPEPSVDALCARHPELAPELRALWDDWMRLRSVERAALPGDPSGLAGASRETPRVPGFECLAELGRGGMGEVWEARDLALGRRVALKLLPPGWLVSDVLRARFRREAVAASRVQHPGIVAVYAAGESDGRAWISQELVGAGRTLRDAIEELARGGEVPPDHERAMAALLREVALALQAAHQAGVVHRDLKPQNLLLDSRREARVADFGLAWLEGEAPLSRTGEFLGTWLYASPEHLRPDPRGVDAQSDVFSLGIVLYEALTLQRPFRGDGSAEIAHAILHEDPAPPRALRARIPHDLSVICLKALEKSRAGRYASMRELADDLGRFLAHEPIRARPPGPLGRAQRWSRRHPARATALALGGFALVALSIAQWRTLRALEDTETARGNEARANATLVVARDEARADRAVSDEVLEVLGALFDAAAPTQLGRGGPTVRDLVQRGIDRLRAGEPALPAARARLAATLGRVLNALGDWPGAEELLAEAYSTWTTLALAESPEALDTRALLAEVRMNLGRSDEARELSAGVLEAWRLGHARDVSACRVRVVLGLLDSRAGDLPSARAHLEEALRLRNVVMGDDPHELAYARSLLAGVDWREGRFADGLARIEPDLELLRPLLPAGNTLALDAFNMRGLCLLGLDRVEEARDVFLESLGGAESALGVDHPRSLNLRINLGSALVRLGELDEAEELFRDVQAVAGQRYGPASREFRTASNDLATNLFLQGRFGEAETELRALLEIDSAMAEAPMFETSQVRYSLATCLWRQGRGAEAVEEAQRAMEGIPADFHLRPRMQAELDLMRQALAGQP